MSRTAHFLYILTLSILVALVVLLIAVQGYDYYMTPVGDRPFNEAMHSQYKPSGILGHGFGIAGSLCMIIGVGIYMARKRFRWLSRTGLLRHWLEFHIFLCTLGPALILYHTAFKFGGLVAISFWSMVAVFLSGIIGRFIYIRIPRTLEGREMSLQEVKELQHSLGQELSDIFGFDRTTRPEPAVIRAELDRRQIGGSERKRILALVRREVNLNRRIGRLALMQKLFRYWHVAHLPFALVMLIIMIIHVAVTLLFGYRWIF